MFHPMVAGVTIPGVGLGLIALAPFFDKNPSHQAERPQVRDRHLHDLHHDVGGARHHRLVLPGARLQLRVPLERRHLLRAVRSDSVAFIVIGVVVILALAAVFLLGTARRRASTGPALSRETRARRLVGRRREPGDRASSPRRVAADAERRASPCPRATGAPVRYEPVDEEELGVTRRQFFNRGILTGLALGVGGFGAASLAFLWPSGAGGSGTQGQRRHRRRRPEGDRRQDPVLQRVGEGLHPAVPEGRREEGAEGVRRRRSSPGMAQGYVALYQKCPHLGCRVPWCQTSQWFECPCHGSKYNRVGEKRGGPAPRGMDRFVLSGLGQQHRRRHRHRDPGPPDRHRHHRPGPRRRTVRVSDHVTTAASTRNRRRTPREPSHVADRAQRRGLRGHRRLHHLARLQRQAQPRARRRRRTRPVPRPTRISRGAGSSACSAGRSSS